MEDFEVYDEPMIKETRKTELPAIEMQVTQLVECDPPILSATASGKISIYIIHLLKSAFSQ